MDLSKHLEKAAEAVKRRNYPFAINLYNQLLGLQPDNGAARAGLRTALYKKAEAKPPSKLFAMLGGGLPLLLANLSRALKQNKSAAKGYERYLSLDPTNEAVNLKLADTLARAGFKQSALAVYRAYADHQPRCLEACREAGLLLYESGEHQDALVMFERALKVDPRDQESLRARKNLAAEGALKQTGIESAKSSRDLMKDKDQAAKLDRSDRLQLSEDEIETELEELETKLANVDGAEAVKVLQRLAKVHEMNKDPQSALDCLEQALQRDPDDADLADAAGDLRLRQQEERVRAARDRGDESAAEFAAKALAEAQVGEFRRRVERNPTDLAMRFALGEALLATGAADDAIAELQQAVKDPRRKAEAHFLLGRAFASKSLADLARGQLDKALEACRGAGVLGKEILYELGNVAEASGDADTALEHYSRILEQDIGFRDVASKVEKLKAS